MSTFTLDCSKVFTSVRKMTDFFTGFVNLEDMASQKTYAVFEKKEDKHTWLCDFIAEKANGNENNELNIQCFSSSTQIKWRCYTLGNEKEFTPHSCSTKIDNNPQYFLIDPLQSKIVMGITSSFVNTDELKNQVGMYCKKKQSKNVPQLRKLVIDSIKKLFKDEESKNEKDELVKNSKKWNKKQLCSWLGYNEQIGQKDVPDEFTDPVFFSIMTEPVVLPDGHSVNRSTFDELVANKLRCPFTQRVIPDNYIAPPNWNLKKAIEAFVEKHAASPKE